MHKCSWWKEGPARICWWWKGTLTTNTRLWGTASDGAARRWVQGHAEDSCTWTTTCLCSEPSLNTLIPHLGRSKNLKRIRIQKDLTWARNYGTLFHGRLVASKVVRISDKGMSSNIMFEKYIKKLIILNRIVHEILYFCWYLLHNLSANFISVALVNKGLS